MNPSDAIKKNVLDSMQTQVESFLIGKIQSGEWPVGIRIPSERDLSIKLDVSRTTVRNAILALTGQGLFDRMIGQGTFVRRQPGRPQGASKTPKGTLGYVVCKERSSRKPISSEAFYFDVFSGVEEETVKSGRHMLFSYVDDFSREEIDSFSSFLDKVDGLVIEEARNPDLLEMIANGGVPAVLLAPTASHDKLDLITIDLAAGVKKAIRYLREAGHSRIGIINGPLNLDSARIRFQAWKEALTEISGPADERYADGNEGWTAESGYAAMKHLLDRCPDMTAVFCANDLLAVGALSALTERGIRVPDDMSIIGFDDTELARHAAPPLTTMKIYSRDMARTAVRRLVERIENEQLPPVRIEFPIDIVARKSCKEVKGTTKEA